MKAVCAFRRSGRAFDILKDLNQRTAYNATRRDEMPIKLAPRTHQITEFLGDQARPLRRGRPCFDVSDSKDEAPRELRRHHGLHTDIQLSAPRNRRWLTLLGRVHSATSRFFEHKEDFGIGLPCAHGTHRSEAAAVASARIFTYANSHEEIKVIHLEAGKWRDSCRARPRHHCSEPSQALEGRFEASLAAWNEWVVDASAAFIEPDPCASSGKGSGETRTASRCHSDSDSSSGVDTPCVSGGATSDHAQDERSVCKPAETAAVAEERARSGGVASALENEDKVAVALSSRALVEHAADWARNGGVTSGHVQAECSAIRTAETAADAKDWVWSSGAPSSHAQVGRTSNRARSGGATRGRAQAERTGDWDWSGGTASDRIQIWESVQIWWARCGGATSGHAQVGRPADRDWSGGTTSDRTQVERADEWARCGGATSGHAQVGRPADRDWSGGATSDHAPVERSADKIGATAAVAEGGDRSGGTASGHAQAEGRGPPEPAYSVDIGLSGEAGALMNKEENRATRPCKRTSFSYRKREALHERAWRVGRDMQANPVKAITFAKMVSAQAVASIYCACGARCGRSGDGLTASSCTIYGKRRNAQSVRCYSAPSARAHSLSHVREGQRAAARWRSRRALEAG